MRFWSIFAFFLLMFLAGCELENKPQKLDSKQYTKFCIEGVTYVVLNNNTTGMTMSIMLDRTGRVISCGE